LRVPHALQLAAYSVTQGSLTISIPKEDAAACMPMTW